MSSPRSVASGLSGAVQKTPPNKTFDALRVLLADSAGPSARVSMSFSH